jgi:hypothetical protein
MRFWVTILLVAAGLFSWVETSWSGTALINAFYGERELVASVFFDQESSEITRITAGELESILPRIRSADCESRLIRIEGFSGRTANSESNFRQTLNRANSVAMYLEQKGVPCLVGVNEFEVLHSWSDNVADALRIDIASYPKMWLLDFSGAPIIDFSEVELR